MNLMILNFSRLKIIGGVYPLYRIKFRKTIKSNNLQKIYSSKIKNYFTWDFFTKTGLPNYSDLKYV